MHVYACIFKHLKMYISIEISYSNAHYETLLVVYRFKCYCGRFREIIRPIICCITKLIISLFSH